MRLQRQVLGLAVAFWSSMGWPALAQDVALTAQANVMVEATFRSSRAYSDPFNQVALDIIFVEPQGRELRVPAFWAGNNVWKVRYASSVLGRHAFRTKYSDTTNPGLHGQTGAVTFEAYTGTNPLFIGENNSLGNVQADNNGTWRCPPPVGNTHDWALVLENL